MRGRFRQIARLESLAAAYLRPREKAHSGSEQSVRNDAFIRTANLCALILYGDPKMEEPLSLAWRRCLESTEWQRCREKHGGWNKYGSDDLGDPFSMFSAEPIASYFRAYLVPDLRGSDEVEKFGIIFEKTPPWLLWLTYADAHARILGIKLPNLSSVQQYDRDLSNFAFEILPQGPFECRPRADGTEDQVAIWTKDLRSKIENKHESHAATPRERKRLLRISERYSRKPPSEQEVITKVAVVHVSSCISGVNRFEHFCIY